MKANEKRADVVAKFAQVGDLIWTPPFGEWPGGYARITELAPDPEGAPDIVFQVESSTHGTIGVLENEMIVTMTRHS